MAESVPGKAFRKGITLVEAFQNLDPRPRTRRGSTPSAGRTASSARITTATTLRKSLPATPSPSGAGPVGGISA